MELFKKPDIDFIGLRWIPIGLSCVVVVGGLAAMAFKGFNYSIEFTGGSLLQVSYPAGAKAGAAARSTMSRATARWCRRCMTGGRRPACERASTSSTMC